MLYVKYSTRDEVEWKIQHEAKLIAVLAMFYCATQVYGALMAYCFVWEGAACICTYLLNWVRNCLLDHYVELLKMEST